MTADFGVNQGLVEEQFLKWVDNPLAVEEAWRAYFESLAPTDWPQISSAGTIMAPVTASGMLSPTPQPPDGNGAWAAAATAASPAPAASREADDEGFRDSVFLPTTAETALDPVLPDNPAIVSRTSFPPSSELLAATDLQARLSALINAYRVRGHLFANLDPLGLYRNLPADDFVLKRYGLAHVDPETIFSTGDLAGPPTDKLGSVIARLKDTYSRTIGVEYTFLENREARNWLRDTMELTGNHIDLSREQQVRILTKLTDAEIFEQFLHTKYTGAKRFSLEGGESVIPMLDILTERASELGVEEMVIGMAHRGRLNVMVNIMEMNVRQIFAGFEDDDPEKYVGTGDVKYHLGYSLDRKTASGNNVHMTLAFNPSHLEFVNPVVEGRVRAKQDRKGDDERITVLPLLIHGDAAFVGQGVVAETLNLSRLQAYGTGGTVHVVINNQIGFTTNPEDSRSTSYCTDITRMLRCPVFHVNGEDPEAVAQAVTLATEYRQRFHGDVVLDLFCYRKYGHNEGDEPRFTQPEMYAAIDRKKTVREVYIDHLVKTGKLTTQQADEIKVQRQLDLENALEDTRKNGNYNLIPASMLGLWTEYRGGSDLDVPDADTRFPMEKLVDALDKLTSYPDWFTPHPRIKRFSER